MRLAAPLVAVVGLASLAACGPEPEVTAKANAARALARDAGAAEPEPGPAPPVAGDGHARKIKDRGEVELTGDRVDAKPGDWQLTDERTVAVISKKGVLIDFGPRGGVDAMVGHEPPTLFASLGTEKLETATFELEHDGAVLHEKRLIQGKSGARYDVFYSLRAGVLFVESIVTAGDEPLLSETLGDEIGWGNVPTWIEGTGFAQSTAAGSTAFVARESLGMSFAAESTDGKTIARISALESNGFHDAPYLSDRPVWIAARASSPRRSTALSWSRKSLGDAALLLPRWGAASTRVVPLPPLPPGTAVEIAKCEPALPEAARPVSDGGAPTEPRFEHLVTRFSYDAERKDVRVPEGCMGLRFTALGHAPSKWVPLDELADAELDELMPKAGTLHVSIHEKGHEGPMPARVLLSGRHGTPDPFFGDDPDRGAALDTLYTEGERTIAVPPGRYLARVNRGFEYSAEEREIEIKDGETTELEVELERVVDTSGWISADCHVHAAPSPDAPSPLPDRVRSLAASGVEVAVATDHNKITDYAPAIRELGLERFITGIVGDEITTREPSFGHFNAYPLRGDVKPPTFEHAIPSAMFAAARLAGAPGLVPIVQMNHPRMGGIGYFELLRFDGDDVARWRERSNLAALDFDAIELFNGDHYAQIGKVEDAMKDWTALLKAGFRPTATGNSDSHKLVFAEAGVPRNLVKVAVDDPAQLDVKDFVASMRAGHVVVVSGPFIRMKAGDKDIGDDVPEGDVELEVEVDAAPWVDVSRVDLVVRGEVAKTWTAFDKGVVRLHEKTTLHLNRGDFVIAIARGSKAMTYLHRGGARPFSFTNPIFAR